jgi:hypothetical protein
VSHFFDEWQFEVQGHGVISTAQENYVHENNCCWGTVDSRMRNLQSISIPSEFPSKFPRTLFALKWTNEKCRLLLWLRGGFLVDHTAPKRCVEVCINWIQQTFLHKKQMQSPQNIEAVCQRTLSTPDFPPHTISTLLPKPDWWKLETTCVFLFLFSRQKLIAFFPGNGRFADIMLSCGAIGIW